MHYHLEVIMPHTDDVQGALDKIMAEFSENAEDAYRPFWDWFVIGGRWAGNKMLARYDKKQMAAFSAKLNDMNVTVSGLQCGKQEISPADQIPMVDALWNEMFPNSGSQTCPMFKHSGSQLSGDVCKLENIPDLTCERVIFAGPKYDGNLGAQFMLSQRIYNGVNSEQTAWSGKVSDAITLYRESLKHYKEEYREKVLPRDDWLVVTVDYHN